MLGNVGAASRPTLVLLVLLICMAASALGLTVDVPAGALTTVACRGEDLSGLFLTKGNFLIAPGGQMSVAFST